MKTAIKYVVLGLGFMLLSGCSKNVNTKGGILEDAKGVTAHGLGLLKRFGALETGEVYTTKAPHNQIYLFKFDNSTLQSKYLPSLNAQGRYLKAHRGARIMIAGHTDSRGSREYNIALGERRAKAVFNLLRMAGVPSNQMRVVSYGQERPVAFSHDEKSYRLNRRVELTYEAIR